MKRSTALTAAGALVLTVAAGISTLAAIDRPVADDPPVMVHYVDQAGNPVPAPGMAQTQAEPAIPQPTVPEPAHVVQPEPVQPYEAAPPMMEPAYQEDYQEYEYEEEEYEEEEYEEEEYDEGDGETYGPA